MRIITTISLHNQELTVPSMTNNNIRNSNVHVY